MERRRYREQEGAFVIEGFRLLEEAVKSGVALEAVLVDENCLVRLPLPGLKDEAIIPVAPGLLDRISRLQTSPGIMAVAGIPSGRAVMPERAVFMAAAVGLADPGNLGTIIRTADAVGMEGVALAGTVDPYNPKVLRGSMGSVFHMALPVFEQASKMVPALRQAGLRTVAADIDGSRELYQVDLTGPLAVLVGGEARGLPGDILEAVDLTIRIPMSRQVESLNVAIAFAVIAYEACRQRKTSR